MKTALSLFILFSAFYDPFSQERPDQQSTPVHATLCELAEHPEQYAGKMIAVHANEMGKDFWIEDFSNKTCSAWTQVMVVYPEQVKPSPGFDLIRDDVFDRFFAEMRKGQNVEATYEGRYDVAYVWRDHKRIDVTSQKGYGKNHRYGARIVLHRVYDVLSHPRNGK